MKKNIFLSFFIFLSVSINAQENNESDLSSKANEIKIAAFKAVIYPALELEYERLLSKNTSVGANIAYVFNDDHPYFDFYTDAYFRFYFNEKKEYGMNGFFAQPYLSFLSKQDTYYYGIQPLDYSYPTGSGSYNTMGFGFALGKKWTNSNGFTIQALLGLGRNFTEKSYFEEIIPRFDVFLGYRF